MRILFSQFCISDWLVSLCHWHLRCSYSPDLPSTSSWRHSYKGLHKYSLTLSCRIAVAIIIYNIFNSSVMHFWKTCEIALKLCFPGIANCSDIMGQWFKIPSVSNIKFLCVHESTWWISAVLWSVYCLASTPLSAIALWCLDFGWGESLLPNPPPPRNPSLSIFFFMILTHLLFLMNFRVTFSSTKKKHSNEFCKNLQINLRRRDIFAKYLPL